MKKSILIVCLVIFVHTVFAQHTTLCGTVKISIEKGTLDGDLTLTEFPEIENYRLAINSGLNVEYIKDQDNRNIDFSKQYSSKLSYESFLYSFPTKEKEGIFLPKSINVKFTGKFPVHNDTLSLNNSGDWKGNIAFSDNTLRIDGNQSSWYPILYDLDRDIRYSQVKYSVEIECEDCDALYLNGSDPVYASSHRFTSEKPSDITLFVGNYDFHFVDNNWYLNPDIDKNDMARFSEITNQFKTYFSDHLEIPYQETIKFVQSIPTTKSNSFLFIEYPTIVNIGRGREDGMAGLISDEYPEDKAFIAHELAHYYFGAGVKLFNSTLSNPISEGFAEYLSLKATKEILGADLYTNLQQDIIADLEDNAFYKPLARITSTDDLNNSESYSYLYFPVLLSAIENEIGEEKMWGWMKNILLTETSLTDYEFLKNCLVESIGSKNESNRIIEKYFQSDNSLNNALEQLVEKDPNH